MAVIKPFSALKFNFRKAGAPETLCSPPYDIIPDPNVWTSRSPYNILHLEGGERLGIPEPYAKAKQTLADWLAQGILYEDENPCLYLYEATFPSQYGGTLTLTGCTISGNSVSGGLGGGLENNDGTVMLTGCTISGNSAGYGGGLANFDSGTATLTDCTVSGNNAHANLPLDHAGGGLDNGIYSTVNLYGCVITNNSAYGSGGGVCTGSVGYVVDGGFIHCGTSGVSTCVFFSSFIAVSL